MFNFPLFPCFPLIIRALISHELYSIIISGNPVTGYLVTLTSSSLTLIPPPSHYLLQEVGVQQQASYVSAVCKWWQQQSGLVASVCNMLSLVIGGRHGAVHVEDVFWFHALITLCFGLFFLDCAGSCRAAVHTGCIWKSCYYQRTATLLCFTWVLLTSLEYLSPCDPLFHCQFGLLPCLPLIQCSQWFLPLIFWFCTLDLSLNPFLDLFCLLDWLSLVVLVLAHLWVLLLINEIVLCLQPLFLGPVPLIPGVSGTDNDIIHVLPVSPFF